MDLPLRMHDVHDGSHAERVISVDGAWGAPGLNLSHWPGNATPRELAHELSTGSALAFARLAPGRRAALAQGCVAIENNHFDTDGTCALYAVLHPHHALAHADALLAMAATGDFFRFPDERALAASAVIEAAVDDQRSPWRSDLAGLERSARNELATLHLFEIVPELVEGRLEPWRALWQPVLDDVRTDVADLAAAARDDIVHFDLSVWTARPLARSARAGARHFDPGRHALFGTSEADRVLAIGPTRSGATVRLIVSTLSWFDIPGRERAPRPDLAELAAELNGLEGTRDGDDVAWRAEPADGPSPELWFGSSAKEAFAEHGGDALAESGLAPARVRRAVVECMRASCPLPE